MLVLTTLVHVGRLISGSAPCPLEVESKCRHKKWVFEQTDDAPGSRKENSSGFIFAQLLMVAPGKPSCIWVAGLSLRLINALLKTGC